MNFDYIKDQIEKDVSGKWIRADQLDLFGKLLVQECAAKLEHDGMVEVAMEIKQHFGVE